MSKGVLAYRQDELPLGIWRPPATWRRLLRTMIKRISRIIHVMTLSQRHRGSKGVQVSGHEEPLLGNLQPPATGRRVNRTT